MSISFIFKYRNLLTNSLNQITKTRRGKIFNFRTEEPRNIWIQMPFIKQNRHKGSETFFSVLMNMCPEIVHQQLEQSGWDLVLNYKAILRISFQN